MNLSLSKSQKKVIKKFNKFLCDGNLNKKDIPLEAQSVEDASDHIMRQPDFLINKSQIDINFEATETENMLLGTGEPGHSRLGQKIRDKEVSAGTSSIYLKYSYKGERN